MEMVVVTAHGKAFIVNLANNNVDTFIYYHYGSLYALSTFTTLNSSKIYGANRSIVVTSGDDRYLCIWDNNTHMLLTRVKAYAPIRCCCVDATGEFIAVGTAGGSIGIYQVICNQDTSRNTLIRKDNSPKNLTELRNRQNTEYTVQLICTRRDCVGDMSDIKYSPNNRMLAVGSHDNYIDIYVIQYNEKTRIC